jgi:hypothetical protein
LLDSVNAVLPSVKEPDMFVTFAALRFDTSDVAEFTLAGDVFALVTDGLIETLHHQEGEFGLQRLEQLLLQNAARPLPEIFDALMAAVSAFGPQKDDRTVLFVCILTRTQQASTAEPNVVSLAHS